MRMFALDISKWQGAIDFTQLRENGVEAVFIRVGAGYTPDPMLQANMLGARSVGLYRFTYFYFYPSINFEIQADNYARWLSPYDPEGAEHCDFENTGGLIPYSSALEMAHRFCQRVDNNMGRITDIYTALWFWKMVGGTTATWPLQESRKLWSANWPIDLNPAVKELLPEFTQAVLAGEKQPLNVPPWPNPTWWQFTAKLSMPGVTSLDVDGDASIPSREEIIKMYHLGDPNIPTIPATLEDLIERYIKLETWARSQGYNI